MKIKKEHREHIHKAIEQIWDRDTHESHRVAVVAEGKAKDVDKRVRWDWCWAAGLTRFMCDEVYPYANDTHIDTVLKETIRKLTA